MDKNSKAIHWIKQSQLTQNPNSTRKKDFNLEDNQYQHGINNIFEAYSVLMKRTFWICILKGLTEDQILRAKLAKLKLF